MDTERLLGNVDVVGKKLDDLIYPPEYYPEIAAARVREPDMSTLNLAPMLFDLEREGGF